MTGEDLAASARALVGAPFRLNGRDPSIGLDCLGVVAAAMQATALVPNGYRLRSLRCDDADAIAGKLGLLPDPNPVQPSPVAPGDVLMFRPGPCQHHLAIAVDRANIVHAHAGLRRVVLGPIPANWPMLACWRLPIERN
ncbi:hypothetical protein [Novosphingobium sp. ZW T3_23]|uniref:hypothetical protein n=1 Tax=Novosphingobium sp. ZW T3_23 TaxID=3378084 RepID=UPI003852F84B